MSSNTPRKPVRFIEENQDLLKAQEGIAGQRKGATDFSEAQTVAHISRPTATYRTPVDRVNGNEFFRRYIDGSLDLSYCVAKVVDAIHRAKDSATANQLNTEEETALSILFPMQFNYIDSGMVLTVSAVQMKLTPLETIEVRRAVAAHLQEELNYNAGMGGSSAPGRHQTRS
jgi:hypothetical protein